jgi:hypothetical protein
MEGERFMKYSKLLLLLLLILPWFSLPLLGKEAIKRFLPAGVFMSLVVRVVHFIAKKRKWWWWYEQLHPKLSGGFSFIWGPYLIGSLWILKFTYGKFLRFIIVNLVVDSMFTYVLVDWLQKLGIASLVRLKKTQLSFIFFVEALLLYGFQFIKEKVHGNGIEKFQQMN